MTTFESLLALSVVFLLACCSPGPVFLLIASTAAQQGRANGVRVGLGVAGATFIWASFTILGLGTILSSVVWAQTAIRLVAGVYLLYLGISMIRSGLSKKPSARQLPPRGSAISRGFVASITNPKALAFFGSAFALTAPMQPTLHYHMMAVVVLTLLSALWHSLLALIFAAPALQRGYQSWKSQIDLLVGFMLACLGGGVLAQGLRKTG
uniref:LysE family transporter n=1 Tax=Bosea sp. NBC_00436 TaxID=2969620 RepID=A0A9E7ZL47_9HYPH